MPEQHCTQYYTTTAKSQASVEIIDGGGVDEEGPPTKWQKRVINKAAAPLDSSEDEYEMPREWYVDNNQDESSFGPAVMPKSKDTEPYAAGPLGKGESGKILKQF